MKTNIISCYKHFKDNFPKHIGHNTFTLQASTPNKNWFQIYLEECPKTQHYEIKTDNKGKIVAEFHLERTFDSLKVRAKEWVEKSQSLTINGQSFDLAFGNRWHGKDGFRIFIDLKNKDDIDKCKDSEQPDELANDFLLDAMTALIKATSDMIINETDTSEHSSIKTEKSESTGTKLTPIHTNVILYGPPGTGKTHALTSLALSFLAPNQEDDANYITYAQNITNGAALSQVSNEGYQSWHAELQKHVHAGRAEFTTFHQNYAYEDFVEGLKAELIGTTVHYKIEPGILKRIAYRALHSWLTGEETGFALSEDQMGTVKDYLSSGKEPHGDAPDSIPNYVLIIDEINRGNVARIFGELITLVEESKRACRDITLSSQPVFATLPYTKERFILPPNLHIIGTMNTADRSLIGLDAALRRRFDFVELPPRPELLSGNVGNINLQHFLSTLNRRIEERDTRDHCIGHAYFMAANSFDDIQAVMRRKVIPQLQEYFHDRPTELKKLLTVGERSFVNDKGVIDSDALVDPDMYTGFATQ